MSSFPIEIKAAFIPEKRGSKCFLNLLSGDKEDSLTLDFDTKGGSLRDS